MLRIDATRRIARALLGGSLAALLAAAPAAVVAAEKVTYLLPTPAFGPWMLALGKGYYAEEGLEVEFRTASVGTPVRNAAGDIVAAINFTGPNARFDRTRLATEVVGPIQDTAGEISRSLGWRGTMVAAGAAGRA